MGKVLPELVSSPLVKRYQKGEPILSKKDIPYGADCIFNAGVCKFEGQYVMAFRDDYDYVPERGCFKHCVIGLAFSRDGMHWDVQKEPFLTVEAMDDQGQASFKFGVVMTSHLSLVSLAFFFVLLAFMHFLVS